MILLQLLEKSQASESFRQAVAAFEKDGRANDGVTFDPQSPPVNVARTLTKLLEAHPELEVERVEVDGASGCEFYRGDLRVFVAGDEQCTV